MRSMIARSTILIVLLSAILLAAQVNAFSGPSVSSFTRRVSVKSLSSPDDEDSKMIDESQYQYKGKVDWDTEWGKVGKNQGQPLFRPKENPRESDKIERKVSKAINQAKSTVMKARFQVPSFDTLKGDWKFWIGILAVLSIGTSLLQSMALNGSSTYDNPGSYYI